MEHKVNAIIVDPALRGFTRNMQHSSAFNIARLMLADWQRSYDRTLSFNRRAELLLFMIVGKSFVNELDPVLVDLDTNVLRPLIEAKVAMNTDADCKHTTIADRIKFALTKFHLPTAIVITPDFGLVEGIGHHELITITHPNKTNAVI
jgi:hypothetical protein